MTEVGDPEGWLSADAVGNEGILRVLGDGSRLPSWNGFKERAVAVKSNPPGIV